MTALQSMGANRSGVAELFSRDGWVQLWDRLLSIQVDLCNRADLDAVRRVPGWENAQRVLDLGCGNGAFIHMLARHAPEKQFVGLDESAPMIELARRRSPANVTYAYQDLNELEPGKLGPFDLVIARFLVQYLPSLSRFLRQAVALLRSGGNLLLYDANDRMVRLHPPVPAVDALYQQIAVRQGQSGVGREMVSRLLERYRQFGLVWHGSIPLVHVADTPSEKRVLRDYLANSFAFSRHCLGLDTDLATAEAELDGWAGREDSWGQFASRVVILTRATPTQPRYRRPGQSRHSSPAGLPAWDAKDWGIYVPATRPRPARRTHRIRVAGFLSYDFGAAALRRLLELEQEHDIEVVGVATDNLISRGARISVHKRGWRYLSRRKQVRRHLRVEALAREAGLEYFSGNVKSRAFSDYILPRWAPGVLVMYGFGQIVPPGVFEYARYGMYNFHPSDLARGEYPGPDPFAGMTKDERETTVLTVHHVDCGLDTGQVVAASPPFSIGIPGTPGYLCFSRWSHRLIEPSMELLSRLITAISAERRPVTSLAGY
jgi:ubiquinone/menaquinone biosynthesis C-methylase UbiE/methionyl-tRNA formyltransferase